MAMPHPRAASNATAETLRRLYPGLALCLVIAMAARYGGEHYGAPAILFALLLGFGFSQLGRDERIVPGVDFVTRTVLRVGIACLGARIGLDQLQALGGGTLLLVALSVPLVIGLTLGVGRLLRLPPLHSLVAGTAVAVCGASAALAVAAVLPRGKLAEHRVVSIVVGVTALGSAAMIAYPPLTAALGFSATQAGVFLGGSIHDVAQAAGAGYLVSEPAGDAATITKLLRVAMLTPLVLLLAWLWRGETTGSAPVPLFLVAFLALVALNSLGLLPEFARATLQTVSVWCLLATMAGLGIKTAFGDMLGLGWRPLAQLLVITVLLAALMAVIVHVAPLATDAPLTSWRTP